MVRNKSSYTVTDAGSKQENRTIISIVIKIVLHHGKLVNVFQSVVTEALELSIAWIILFMCLIK